MRSASLLPTAFMAALTMTFAAATPTAAQAQLLVPVPVHDEIEAKRSTFSDTEIVLGKLWQVGSDCQRRPVPKARVLKDAKGGTLTFREARLVPTKAWQEKCGTEPIEAVELVYKARANYAGTDQPQIDIAYSPGVTRKVSFLINVRKTPASATPTEVEAEFPLKRSVFAGNEIVLGTIRDYGPNCEEFSPPATRVLKDATGGTLSFRESKLTIRTKDGKGRCEGKVVNGIEYAYKARADFSGTDEPEIEIGFRGGTTRKIKLAIAVRGMKEGAQDAAIDSALSARSFKRDVFSGTEIRVAAPNVVQADCTTGQIADIRVVAAPEHGDLRVDTVKLPVDRRTGNSRNHCNGKEIEARAYFYKSKDGYIGGDKFTVDVDFKTGKVERYTYDVRVR